MEFVRLLKRIVEWFGALAGWMNVALILVICVDVALRYVFQMTRIWVIELEWHLFGAAFLLGGAATLLADRHVRVDIFYQRMPHRWRVVVDLVGYLLLLIPWSLLILNLGWDYVRHAWQQGEGSPNPGGLPYYFIIKSTILIGFGLMIIAGMVRVVELLKGLGKWSTSR